MAKKNPKELPEELPTGITPKIRKRNGATEHVHTKNGIPVYRVRVWDPVLRKQVEKLAEGLDEAKTVLAEFERAKRRPGRLQAERVTVFDVAVRYVDAYATKPDGTARPLASVTKEITYLNTYILPILGNAWIGDVDLPEMNDTVRELKLQDGTDASPSTKSGAAGVIRRLFTWARAERIIPVNPALELRTGWGGSRRRRVLIPSIPQVKRLAEALEYFHPGLGDVVEVIAFVGPRWEEIVAVVADEVDIEKKVMPFIHTASESGGRRDARDTMKTDAGKRDAVIPDIAMPAVLRLIERGAEGRRLSGGEKFSRLVNGARGGYFSYSVWRRKLYLARGRTSAHPDGPVNYTAQDLRHVCASILIASGATDSDVAYQMGHASVQTTKDIYGHLFAQDRAALREAMNSTITRLFIEDEVDEEGEESPEEV